LNKFSIKLELLTAYRNDRAIEHTYFLNTVILRCDLLVLVQK